MIYVNACTNSGIKITCLHISDFRWPISQKGSRISLVDCPVYNGDP